MSDMEQGYPEWLTQWMIESNVEYWGVADLREFNTPIDETGKAFPRAIAWIVPMNAEVMVTIQSGPNQPYADEYSRVNQLINAQSAHLAELINSNGNRALRLPASERTDTANIKGDFPHKTAATRAGLGWIGKNCQLITKPYGPWIRLGTVFTDLDIPVSDPVERDHCGRCIKCIEACPADALTGKKWYPGIEREKLLDVVACDTWKKENYYLYHRGHNCGICAAVCPWGLKVLKRKK